jgi:hypothetical protein
MEWCMEWCVNHGEEEEMEGEEGGEVGEMEVEEGAGAGSSQQVGRRLKTWVTRTQTITESAVTWLTEDTR